jgi:hypothetical protein
MCRTILSVEHEFARAIEIILQSSKAEKLIWSDFQGKGTFPAKTVRANILKRIAVTVSSATAGAHASFGPHAYVFAFGGMEGNSVKNGVLEDWTGSPRVNTSVIVVHPTVSNDGNGKR